MFPHYFISINKRISGNSLYEALFFKIIDIYSTNKERKKILSFLGRPFEEYVQLLTKTSVKSRQGYRFIDEFKYGKDNKDSSDAYILLDDKLLIIEAKSKRPNIKAFILEDSKESYNNAIDTLIIEPSLQAYARYKEIINNSEHRNKFLKVNEIYIVCVSLLNITQTKDVYSYVNLEIRSKLSSYVKECINFNIEEFEYLCGMIESDMNLFDFLKKYTSDNYIPPLINSLNKLKLKSNNSSVINNAYSELTDNIQQNLFPENICE